jgi:hypothetical protein
MPQRPHTVDVTDTQSGEDNRVVVESRPSDSSCAQLGDDRSRHLLLVVCTLRAERQAARPVRHGWSIEKTCMGNSCPHLDNEEAEKGKWRTAEVLEPGVMRLMENMRTGGMCGTRCSGRQSRDRRERSLNRCRCLHRGFPVGSGPRTMPEGSPTGRHSLLLRGSDGDILFRAAERNRAGLQFIKVQKET